MDPIQARFQAALELRELAIDMRREALRREDPSAPPEVIEARLREWVLGPKGQLAPEKDPIATAALGHAAEDELIAEPNDHRDTIRPERT